MTDKQPATEARAYEDMSADELWDLFTRDIEAGWTDLRSTIRIWRPRLTQAAERITAQIKAETYLEGFDRGREAAEAQVRELREALEEQMQGCQDCENSVYLCNRCARSQKALANTEPQP